MNRARGHDVSRLEAFSDAFAFALTLLVVSLEVFDVREAIGHHLVSMAAGAMSLLVALLAPLPLVPLAPLAFFLMGPGHWWWGARAGRQRRQLVEAAAKTPTPAST